MNLLLLGLFTPVNPVPPAEGGGLAMIYRESLKVSSVAVPVHGSFESIALQLNGPIPTIVASVYRPPKLNNNFINEFAAFITHL